MKEVSKFNYGGIGRERDETGRKEGELTDGGVT
jgi:hypothetical protein